MSWEDGLSFLGGDTGGAFDLPDFSFLDNYNFGDAGNLYGPSWLDGLSFLQSDPTAGSYTLDGSFLGNLSNLGSFSNPMNEPLFFDSQTGQVVTQSQMNQIIGGGTGSGTTPTPTTTQQSGSLLGNLGTNFQNQPLSSSIQALGALLGLGTAGAGLYSAISGGPNAAQRTTTQSTTSTKSPATPQQIALTGGAGATGPTSGTGLTGLSQQAIANLGGPQGLLAQQQAQLQALQSQIPQLNPAITQALGTQALGMAQGQLPALNDPIAQQRIADVFAPGFAALNYNSNQALDAAKTQLAQRGFLGGDLREGPTQALTAPILAAQELGRAQLLGQQSQAQLNLAQTLPGLGAQLANQSLQMQNQPFQSGLNLASAYNTPAAIQSGIPLDLLRIMESGRSTSTSTGVTAPDQTFLQRLVSAAPALQSAGNIFGALSQQGGLFGSPQQTNSLSGLQPGIYRIG